MQEDTTGAFYNATATDIDGQSISFAIDGGEDANAFRITSAGALSFASPPDFEAPIRHRRRQPLPRDAARQRRHALERDGAVGHRHRSQQHRLPRAARGVGISSPVFVAPVPDGTGRVYVGELAGRIDILSPGTGTIAPMPLLDLRGQLSTNGERGLLGFATSPDFTSSGQFFVFVTDPVGTIEVRRYTVSASNRDIADPSTMRVILRQPHPRTNHNGGWIGFDRTGYLYVAIGDGGGAGDPDNNGQNPDTWLGKILRIDITRDDFPADNTRNYAIPVDNPFRTARRCAGSVGAGPAQSVPRELRLRAVRHGRRRIDHRRRRRRHGRGNRRDARPRRQPGRELRLVGARGIAAVQGPRRSGLPFARGRIPARHRARAQATR